jgi:hypothetical protein
MWEKRTVVGILLALLALAGCGGSGGEAHPTSQETPMDAVTASSSAEKMKEAAAASKAIRCLDAAGLSDVKKRDLGLWGGLHDHPTYAILVHKLAKPAKAPRVVAGEYAVTGSFKVVAVGRGLMGYDGIQADALVQTVAECLGG